MLLGLNMSDHIEQLLDLASKGQDDQFIKLFDQLANDQNDELYDVDMKIGCAAVDGKSKKILTHINKFYEKPFEIFSHWLAHAITTGDVKLAIWMAKNIIKPSSEEVDAALLGGNFAMIKSMAKLSSDSHNMDYYYLFSGQATKETIRKVCKLFEDDIAIIISVAAEHKVIWFLKEQLDEHPEEVLNAAIYHELIEIYTKIKPEHREFAFDAMIIHGKDELADTLFPFITVTDTLYLKAAQSGCLSILKKLPMPSTSIFKQALEAGIVHDPVVEWLLSLKNAPLDIVNLLLMAAEKGNLMTMRRLLELDECKQLVSLQPVLSVAVKKGRVDLITILYETKRTDPTTSELMITAATLRRTDLILILQSYGGDIAVAFRNRVLKNDSDTALLIQPLVSVELRQWAVDYAHKINNTRMMLMLSV